MSIYLRKKKFYQVEHETFCLKCFASRILLMAFHKAFGIGVELQKKHYCHKIQTSLQA